MLQQELWPLRYSLEGAIKRILFEKAHPLSEEELETLLKQDNLFRELRAKEPVRTRIQKALQASHGPFVQVGQLWTLRESENDSFHDLIYQIFTQYNRAIKQGEVLRILQQQTHRSKGELMSHINLESDWRFARLEEGDWVLTEWNLADLNNGVETGKEEQKMNQQTDLVDLIIKELEGYKSQLEQRTQEIPNEVVEKFNMEDLKAIEGLMDEKKRVNEFLDDLQQLVGRWSQPKVPVNE